MVANLAFHVPVQPRAHRTVDRILQALEELLRDRSFEQISISEIIAAAGVSAGSFYARFPSKSALLPLAYERYSVSATKQVEEDVRSVAWERLDFRGRIDAALQLILDSIKFKTWLMRALVLFARARPGDVSPDAAQRSERDLNLAARLLAPNAAADQANALRFATYATMTLTREHALFGEAPLAKALAISTDDFKREMADMIEAYLRRKNIEEG
jgi:AcrR family transcriptional regulator